MVAAAAVAVADRKLQGQQRLQGQLQQPNSLGTKRGAVASTTQPCRTGLEIRG